MITSVSVSNKEVFWRAGIIYLFMAETITPVIRFTTRSDLDALADLATQLGYLSTPEQVRPRLEDLLSHTDENAVIVAELDGHVVGWVHAHITRLLVNDPEVEIDGLVVDEGVRGQGVGDALMRAAEGWALDHGCSSVYLRSNTMRTQAHEFYKRLGYEIIKSQYALRKTF